MRTELIENKQIEKRFEKTDYKLLEVRKVFTDLRNPQRFRIKVMQRCPNGHTLTKRWHGRITCSECSVTLIKVNPQGLYLHKDEQVAVKIKSRLLDGVERKIKKNGKTVYTYFPSEIKLRTKILLYMLKLIGK